MYYSYNNGYNSTLGGAGNKNIKISEETKRMMSVAHKGKSHTEETKKKISKSNKGKTKEEFFLKNTVIRYQPQIKVNLYLKSIEKRYLMQKQVRREGNIHVLRKLKPKYQKVNLFAFMKYYVQMV